jgi:hypothetical protein
MTSTVSVQRPALPPTVRWSALLLCASVVPGIVDLVRGVTPPTPGQPGWFGPVVGGFSIAVVIAIALFIRNGRNWARILYVVFFVLGVPAMLGVTSELRAWLDDRPTRAVLLLLQCAVQLAVLIMLYLPEANAWFRAVKLARKSA